MSEFRCVLIGNTYHLVNTERPHDAQPLGEGLDWQILGGRIARRLNAVAELSFSEDAGEALEGGLDGCGDDLQDQHHNQAAGALLCA